METLRLESLNYKSHQGMKYWDEGNKGCEVSWGAEGPRVPGGDGRNVERLMQINIYKLLSHKIVLTTQHDS